MERCFKELKDYIRVKGFFQNEVSAEKFLYLFFKDKNSKTFLKKFKVFFSTLKGDVSRALHN